MCGLLHRSRACRLARMERPGARLPATKEEEMQPMSTPHRWRVNLKSCSTYALGLTAAVAMSGLALSASNPGAGPDPGAAAPPAPYGVFLMPSNTGYLDPGVAEQGKAPFFPSRAMTDG